MFIGNFFLGLLMVAGGALMVKYNGRITMMFGRSPGMEKYLGRGAMFIAFYLLAAFFIFYGFLLTFSLHDDFTNAVFGPVFDSL